ncbi:MAG: triple tyrosine motif-containing protein [Saprospiraceae bacterium]
MVFTPSGDLYISSILNGVIHVSSQELDRYLHKINKIINKSNRIKIDHRYDITVNGLCAIDDQYVFFAGLNHAGFIHILSDSVQELVTPDDHFPQFKKCMLIGHQIFIASESGLFVVIDRSIIIYKPANGKEINERINCICHHKANIYLGTANGLIIVNTAIDSLKYFTLTDGLVGNNIQSIVSDDNGRVWLATRSGLSCLDPATHHSINYTEKDGLLSNQLNRLALRDSILLITSENGLNSLSTHDRISEENNSAIHLIDFKISGTSILKNKNSINAINYMYNRSIKLPWYVNNFSAEFTVPEFNHPDNVEYQYRLVPFDKEWIQSGNEGKANYTNLPAGNYSLSLKYKIKSGEWHIQDNSVSIVVGTAWFRSWWFYGLCGISFAGLIYGYYRMQIRQFSRLQDTKNTIAADLHDEIGSTITSINILGKILEQSISATDTSSKKIIDQITTQSKNIQQNLSDIVWSIRPENELAENLEIRVREFLDRTLEPLGIDVKFEISGKKSDHRLNEIYRKEILLILKEAINNIAKHSNATQVKISFTYLRDQVIISIEDNGSSKINVSSGTGIKSMQARAEKLKGSLQWDHTNGNRIKLSIPLV